ncbi:hypothetical protein GCM10009760_52680 [Kitasatospora kazusensis]|uniref:Uncharacterized protein n=1 Tax=Kitasatospora kazusensis TaxID=407974 RepID=A0ABN3A536_9ACTN
MGSERLDRFVLIKMCGPGADETQMRPVAEGAAGLGALRSRVGADPQLGNGLAPMPLT